VVIVVTQADLGLVPKVEFSDFAVSVVVEWDVALSAYPLYRQAHAHCSTYRLSQTVVFGISVVVIFETVSDCLLS